MSSGSNLGSSTLQMSDFGGKWLLLSVCWFPHLPLWGESDEILCLSSRTYLLQSVLLAETIVFFLRGKSDQVIPLLKKKILSDLALSLG